MSAYDYMSRSDYDEDVHKFPVVDAEGKPTPITSNARIIGVRTYVIKSYVEDIQRRKVRTSATNSKESQPYNNSYGRPPEVHDLLSKIMTEVNRNGPPPKTSDPYPGTYNQGRPWFPPEPPARASDPNLGRGRYSLPVNEGTIDNFGADHEYGSSPSKVDPMRGYGYDYGPNDQWGKSSSPVYDRPHQGGYGAPNHQRGGYDAAPRSSSPIYDRRTDKFPKTPPSHEKPGSQVPHGYDVPRDNISAVNPKEYGFDSRLGNPDARDYKVPSNKWDKLSGPVYDHSRENPEKLWEGSARKTPTPGEYEVPSNQWERSSSPIYDHRQNNPSRPKNQWASLPVKPQSPREYGAVSNPRNQWGNLPVKPQSPGDYGAQPSSPKYQRENPPVKPQSPRDYGVQSNQWEKSSSPKYQKGSPLVKPQSLGDYGVPSDQWEGSSSPKYQKGSPPVKTQSPGDYVVPSDQWEKSSSPRGSPPVKPQSPGDYGAPSNQQVKSSSPVYDYPQKSSSKNQWGSSPLKPQSPRVSTMNDKPKAPQGTLHEYEYDVPKDNRKGSSVTNKPISEEGWRSSNPYIPDLQPTKEFGKGTIQRMPSANYNNMGEALDQLSLDSPRGTAPTGLPESREFTAAPPVGPRQHEAMVEPSDIDNRNVIRRYGSRNFQEKPYVSVRDQDLKRTLSSKEVIEKYNGSFVPR